MPVCQNCGTDNPVGTAVCTQCGTPFPKRKAALAGTMVGMPSPLGPGGPLGGPAAQQPAPAEPQKPSPAAAQPAPVQPAPVQPAAAKLSAQKKAALAGTMIGMPSPVGPGGPGVDGPTPAARPAAAHPKQDLGLGKTMVGTGAPPEMANTEPPPAATPVQPATPAASPTPGGAKKPELKGTLLGIAQPGIAPDQSRPAAPPSVQKGTPKNQFKGTVMGVAQPGIAPDPDAVHREPQHSAQPSQHSAQAAHSPAQQAPQPVAPAAAATPADLAPPSSVMGPPAGVPAGGSKITTKQLLLAGGAVLFAGLLGGALAVMGPRPVTVQVDKFAIDEDGNDKLVLSCDECPNDSVLFLDGAEAKVTNKKATLSPLEPLSLGRNELAFQLREGEEIRDAKPVILPIAFRVLTDWTGLKASPPYAEVTVAAPNGSSVTIEGKELAVKNEKAVHRVAFDKETLGEASKMEQVDASLAITVVVEGKPRETQAELRNGVTPLTLSSLPLVHQLGGKSVTLTGTTAAGANVTVGDEEVTADDKGRFSVTLESPGEGDISVMSQSKDLVARRVTVELTKKAGIPDGAVTKYSDVKPGVQVNLLANVIESRIAEGATRALVEVAQGCEAPPCLLRAVYAEPRKLAPNRRVRMSGLVAGGNPLTVRVRRFH